MRLLYEVVDVIKWYKNHGINRVTKRLAHETSTMINQYSRSLCFD
jgi:hypothetical protein